MRRHFVAASGSYLALLWGGVGIIGRGGLLIRLDDGLRILGLIPFGQMPALFERRGPLRARAVPIAVRCPAAELVAGQVPVGREIGGPNPELLQRIAREAVGLEFFCFTRRLTARGVGVAMHLMADLVREDRPN